jgi:Domain of unknown function (DUF5615)
MKVKLDENLPLRIAIELRARSHDVHTAVEKVLRGGADTDIWQAAQRESRILITQDLDFSAWQSSGDCAHTSPIAEQTESDRPGKRTLRHRRRKWLGPLLCRGDRAKDPNT